MPLLAVYQRWLYMIVAKEYDAHTIYRITWFYIWGCKYIYVLLLISKIISWIQLGKIWWKSWWDRVKNANHHAYCSISYMKIVSKKHVEHWYMYVIYIQCALHTSIWILNEQSFWVRFYFLALSPYISLVVVCFFYFVFCFCFNPSFFFGFIFRNIFSLALIEKPFSIHHFFARPQESGTFSME